MDPIDTNLGSRALGSPGRRPAIGGGTGAGHDGCSRIPTRRSSCSRNRPGAACPDVKGGAHRIGAPLAPMEGRAASCRRCRARRCHGPEMPDRKNMVPWRTSMRWSLHRIRASPAACETVGSSGAGPSRGGGAHERAERSGAPKGRNPGLAFRLGVRTVDLQVALRRGDTALAGSDDKRPSGNAEGC